MRGVLLLVALFVLYLVLFAVGSFTSMHVVSVLSRGDGYTVRLFVWDGVLLTLGAYAATLLLLVPKGRLRGGWPWATGALLLTLLCGLLLRLGFVTRGT